jgi:hypothetical protein
VIDLRADLLPQNITSNGGARADTKLITWDFCASPAPVLINNLLFRAGVFFAWPDGLEPVSVCHSLVVEMGPRDACSRLQRV